MKLTRTTRNAGWLVVAGLLGAALIAPAGVTAADPVYATVTGHAAGGSDANHEWYWEAKGYDDCTKLDDPKIDGKVTSTWVLTKDYGLVVVKAGSDKSTQYANTLFENASAGETVWADSNGNNTFDPGGKDGDKEISHIIFCDPPETTTTTTTTDTQTTDTQTTDTQTTGTQTTGTQTTGTQTTGTQTTGTQTTTSVTGSISGETSTQTTTSVTGSISGETGKPTPPSTDAADFSSTSSTTGSGWSLLLIAMAGLLAGALLLTPAAAARKR